MSYDYWVFVRVSVCSVFCHASLFVLDAIYCLISGIFLTIYNCNCDKTNDNLLVVSISVCLKIIAKTGI